MEAIFRSVGFHLGALLGGMKVLKADPRFCLKKKRNPESVSLPSSSYNTTRGYQVLRLTRKVYHNFNVDWFT